MPRLHTALCIAASFFFLTAAVAADKPNLTSTWKMNPAKSDLGSNAIKSRVDNIERPSQEGRRGSTELVSRPGRSCNRLPKSKPGR